MYPPMLPLFPRIARSALQYRTARLAAAEALAQNLGYAGAKYPLGETLPSAVCH